MEPVIKFRGYSIKKMVYSKEDIDFNETLELIDGKAINLSIEQGISEDLKNAKLKIIIKLVDESISLNILLEVIGDFEINNINDLETIRDFLAVNGTAIVYPYVRSIVSMVSSLDSENAIILPTINTSNFAD